MNSPINQKERRESVPFSVASCGHIIEEALLFFSGSRSTVIVVGNVVVGEISDERGCFLQNPNDVVGI